MPNMGSPDDLAAYLSRNQEVFLLVESKELDKFILELPVRVQVLARRRIGHKTTALLSNRVENG